MTNATIRVGIVGGTAVGTGLGDGLDDPGALDPLEVLELLAQFLGASGGQRDFVHE